MVISQQTKSLRNPIKNIGGVCNYELIMKYFSQKVNISFKNGPIKSWKQISKKEGNKHASKVLIKFNMKFCSYKHFDESELILKQKNPQIW